MEINQMYLSKKTKKIINNIDKFISCYKMAKNDNKPPKDVLIDRSDYSEIERQLTSKKCLPPYTYQGVNIIPREIDY